MKYRFFILILLFIYHSDMLFAQWISANGSGGGNPTCVAINQSTLYAGTEFGGLIISTDSAKTWQQIDDNLSDLCIQSLLINDSTIFIGTSNEGIYKSIHNGTSWKNILFDEDYTDVQALISDSLHILAGTDKGVYVSSDNGTTWVIANGKLFV